MIVGSDKVYAIENFYVRYLQELCVTVNHFCAQSYFYDYYQSNLLNKLIFKAGVSPILRNINILFKESVEAFKPDIIWVFKGMELFPGSLRWAAEQGIRLVNYNPDNPFLFTGKGSGNKNVTDSIGLYQLHFTYNLSIKKRLEKDYGVKTVFLPFGYDIDDDTLRVCRSEEEIVKMCFLGNPDPQRAALIMSIAEQGMPIDLYGNDWGKFVHHKDIRFFEPVYEVDFWKTLYRYRVQLNLMRIHNEDSHNMRTFEVPGIGAIQLAPDTPEHRMFFDEGKEIFLYKNIKECCEKAKSILALNSEKATAIRNNALRRSIDSGYSYRNRAQQAFTAMNDLMND